MLRHFGQMRYGTSELFLKNVAFDCLNFRADKMDKAYFTKVVKHNNSGIPIQELKTIKRHHNFQALKYPQNDYTLYSKHSFSRF